MSTEALITSITVQNQPFTQAKIKRSQEKYRLMKILQLPQMSIEKPYRNYKHKDNSDCTNHLHQEFNQKSPNLVWASNFTYIKAASKWC